MSMVKSNVGSNNYVQTKFIDDLIHFWTTIHNAYVLYIVKFEYIKKK
jgi:hypothetical protein